MAIQVSKDKNISDGLTETTSSMLDEIELKTVYKNEEGDQQRKKK